VQSFEEVFRLILPRAIRVAYRILGNETQAEDAAAEALARAHASWRKVGAIEYRDAWILRVTANVAVDMSRRQQRIFSVGLSVDAEVSGSSAGDEDPSTDALAGALAALPRRQREVVVLRYLEGLSEAEVAEALGVSTGTVKKNAFRARETLRQRLGSDLEA
jgi:RNA polymerase sigma factor (sigma-70 family)